MIYPYRCDDCTAQFDVLKEHRFSNRPESCPVCGTMVHEQDYSEKKVGGYVSTEGNWSGGKMITQLPPSHPDYMVSSERGMEDAYKRNGICMDTGKFVSRAAQVEATVPRNRRNGEAEVMGAIREE
jgi:hypothetical protein